MIQNPPALKPFTETQTSKFLQAIAKGHNEELAAFKAGILPSELSDLLASLPMHALEIAKMKSKLALAEVKERMTDIMLDARNPEEPMSPELALDILERREPDEWGKRNTIQLKAPEPRLAPEEHARLAKLFALPDHQPRFIDLPANEDNAFTERTHSADAEGTL